MGSIYDDDDAAMATAIDAFRMNVHTSSLFMRQLLYDDVVEQMVSFAYQLSIIQNWNILFINVYRAGRNHATLLCRNCRGNRIRVAASGATADAATGWL